MFNSFSNNSYIYTKLKVKKDVDYYFENKNWIVLNFIENDQLALNINPNAIIVNEENYKNIFNLIPKNKKIIIIAKWNRCIFLLKYLNIQKYKKFYFYINNNILYQ